MNRAIGFAAVVAIALTSWAGAQEDRNTYYYQQGQRVRVSIEARSVAVRFSVTPDAGRIASVGEGNELRERRDELYSPLRRHRTVVYEVLGASTVTNEYLANLQERVRQLGVADVGRVLTTETGAVAVLTDQLSVGFTDRAKSLSDFEGLNVAESLTQLRTLNARPLVVSYRVNAGARQTALEIANAIYEHMDSSGQRLVIYAAPTLRFPAELRHVPNQPQKPIDDHFGEQWHLDNQFQANIDAPEAWDYTRGSTSTPSPQSCVVANRVRIAVFDNGVEADHEDLVDNVSAGRDYRTLPFGTNSGPDPLDPVTNPDPPHGTQAAGVIAACGNNHKGVSGVCPLCQIVPVKIDMFYAEGVRDAFYDAVNELGVDVISNSWGAHQSPELVEVLPIITGTNPVSPGIPVFFAVPNNVKDSCATDLSGLDSVIAVSASTNGDKAGLSGGFGACVDLVAPTQQGAAGKIITTNLADAYSDTFSGFGGTSASTAIVSGVAGLVLSLNPQLTQMDVRNILEHTADKIALVPTGQTYTDGFSPRAGYGRVNAHRAVVPVVKITTTAPAPPATIAVNQPFAIKVSASAPHLLASIGWSRTQEGCPGSVEDWHAVANEAFHGETWSGLSLSTPGTYVFRPNAKDKKFPAVDGYPHIASDASLDLPEIVIKVQGTASGCFTPPPTETRALPLPPVNFTIQ